MSPALTVSKSFMPVSMRTLGRTGTHGVACQLPLHLGPSPVYGRAGLQGDAGQPWDAETPWDIRWGGPVGPGEGTGGDSCRGAVVGSLGVRPAQKLLCLVMRQRPT